MTSETKPDRLSFEVEVKYLTSGAPSLGQKPGWKFAIKWPTGDGVWDYRHGYGYQTPDSAKAAAEYAADRIALSARTPETYTYTPEF